MWYYAQARRHYVGPVSDVHQPEEEEEERVASDSKTSVANEAPTTDVKSDIK